MAHMEGGATLIPGRPSAPCMASLSLWPRSGDLVLSSHEILGFSDILLNNIYKEPNKSETC